MSSIETLREVINHNWRIFNLSRELNKRAGGNPFPVPSLEDMKMVVSEVCGGARCAAEIPDIAGLILPDLDEKAVTSILRDNPNQIALLGMTFPVNYDDDLPTIGMSFEGTSANRWQELPDAGVKLPSGRAVRVLIRLEDYTTIADHDIRTLKRKCEARQLKPLWDRWLLNTPVLDAPNLNDLANATVAPVKEVRYGQSPIDSKPLMAYGTICINPNVWYVPGPFKSSWHQDRAEAEAERALAVTKLEQIKSETKQRSALDTLMITARTKRAKLQSYPEDKGREWFDVTPQLRGQVDKTVSSFYSASTVDTATQWIALADGLIAEIEKIFQPKPVDLSILQARFGKGKTNKR